MCQRFHKRIGHSDWYQRHQSKILVALVDRLASGLDECCNSPTKETCFAGKKRYIMIIRITMVQFIAVFSPPWFQGLPSRSPISARLHQLVKMLGSSFNQYCGQKSNYEWCEIIWTSLHSIINPFHIGEWKRLMDFIPPMHSSFPIYRS
jgi:hypothetical protein